MVPVIWLVVSVVFLLIHLVPATLSSRWWVKAQSAPMFKPPAMRMDFRIPRDDGDVGDYGDFP
jgi:hypothetical protein